MKKKVMVFTERALALSETFIAAHCRSLQRYDYTLVALENGGAHHADVPRILINGDHPGRWERLSFRLGKNAAMDRLVTEIKPDIIHGHYLMGGAFMAPYASRHGIPLVATAHGHDVIRRIKRFSPYDQLFARQNRLLKKTAARVLPVSVYLRDKLIAQGFDPARLAVHYLGIEIGDVPPANISASPPRVVYAGRLVEKKGLDKVLAAFEQVRSRMQQAELHIAGDGPLRPLVMEALNKVDGIVYHGAMENARVLELMATARLFTMPSRETGDDSEGFGLVLLEAESRGVPVVTANLTGTAEALIDGKTGIAVDAMDETALANAFLSLLSDPAKAATMGLAAYDYVRENFDIVQRTRDLEVIYDEVLNERMAIPL